MSGEDTTTSVGRDMDSISMTAASALARLASEGNLQMGTQTGCDGVPKCVLKRPRILSIEAAGTSYNRK